MLVDSKCLKALGKASDHFVKCAEQLALQSENLGGASAEFTLHFLEEDEVSDGEYIATLSIKVRKV